MNSAVTLGTPEWIMIGLILFIIVTLFGSVIFLVIWLLRKNQSTSPDHGLRARAIQKQPSAESEQS